MCNRIETIVKIYTNNAIKMYIVNSVNNYHLNPVHSLLVYSRLASVIGDSCREFDLRVNLHKTKPWQRKVVFPHRFRLN